LCRCGRKHWPGDSTPPRDLAAFVMEVSGSHKILGEHLDDSADLGRMVGNGRRVALELIAKPLQPRERRAVLAPAVQHLASVLHDFLILNQALLIAGNEQ
jgi:hypothetical protein